MNELIVRNGREYRLCTFQVYRNMRRGTAKTSHWLHDGNTWGVIVGVGRHEMSDGGFSTQPAARAAGLEIVEKWEAER